MTKLRDRRQRQDLFYRRAKHESYAARSVYKLEEIDKRFRLLRTGQRILDLGCRPGSWMQYAASRVGESGFVVGLDREPLSIALPANTAVLVGDVLQLEPAALRAALPAAQGSCFHLVLSDMAPDTSGIAFTDQVRSVELFQRALALAVALSCPQGSFVGKLFMGEGFEETVQLVRRHYARAKIVRPDATRKSSVEVFLVAQGLRR